MHPLAVVYAGQCFPGSDSEADRDVSSWVVGHGDRIDCGSLADIYYSIERAYAFGSGTT